VPRLRYPGWKISWSLLIALLAAASCSGDDQLEPNSSLSQLVGDWDAIRFVVKNKANPAQAPELIRELGANFTINVQPSGQYTAVLVYQGTPITEIGLLELDGGEVVFRVSYPAPGINRSRYALTAPRLVLDGDTQFDFNRDGSGDPAEAHIELNKR